MLLQMLVGIPSFMLAFALSQMQSGQVGVIRVEVPIPFEGFLKHTQVVLRNANGWMGIPQEFDGPFDVAAFEQLMIGSYEVAVNAEGYDPQRVPVALGDPTRPVTVKVTLRAKPASASASLSVSLDELSRTYPKKAIQDYEKAVEENRKGNSKKAVELLQSALRSAPEHYAAHNTLGTVYQKLGRFPEAEDEYKRARDLRPNSEEPLVNLGSLYLQESESRASEGPAVVRGILSDARDVLRRALGIKGTAMAYYLLGTVYYRASAYPEAAESLILALQNEPHMGAARLQLANVYLKVQGWNEALAQFDAYLAENPSAPDGAAIQETRAKVLKARSNAAPAGQAPPAR